MKRKNNTRYYDENAQQIGLIIFPFRNSKEEVGINQLAELINILSVLVKELLVITGNYYSTHMPDNVKLINIGTTVTCKSDKESVLSKACRLLEAEFRIALNSVVFGDPAGKEWVEYLNQNKDE